jgi:hypothetical protein
MTRILLVLVLSGITFSQSLVQEIIAQLAKPNNYYGDVAPLIGKMQAEATSQPAPQPQAGRSEVPTSPVLPKPNVKDQVN